VVLTDATRSSYTDMKSFACIGWKVTLDKRTYNNYKNLEHTLLNDKIKKLIKYEWYWKWR